MSRRKKKSAEPNALLPIPPRDVCRTGPRPCPHETCRYHLGFNIDEQGKFREVKGWKKRQTCSLDIAESGQPLPLRELGEFFGVTRERARQLEMIAMMKLHKMLLKKGLTQQEVHAALAELHPVTNYETAKQDPNQCDGSRAHRKSVVARKIEERGY